MDCRFGTQFAVVDWIVRAADEESDTMLSNRSHGRATKTWIVIKTICYDLAGKVMDLPALNDIATCLSSLVDVQRELQAEKMPTIQLVIPEIDGLRSELTVYAATTNKYSSYTKVSSVVV